MIAVRGDVLIYKEEPLPAWLRLFAVFLGAGVATVIPAPFLMHTNWSALSSLSLLSVLCIVVSVVLGCFFMFLGLSSACEFILDGARGQAERRFVGPVYNATERFALVQVGKPKVFLRDSTEEGRYPILELNLPRGRVRMACFKDEAEAHLWARQMEAILSRHAPN